MFGLPTSVLIGAGVVLAVWLATLVLSVFAFRSRGRRGMVFAVVALVISLVGATILSARIGKKITSTDILPGGEERIRTSGWQVDSKWFFIASSVISLSALVVSMRARAPTTA